MASPNNDSAPIAQENNIKRRKTIMKEVVRAKSKGIKFEVGWNNKGQPIEPNKSKFVSYIGVITRKMVPIIYDNWHDVPDKIKDNIWDDVQSTFDIDERRRKFVLKEAGRLLRSFRAWLTRHIRDDDGIVNENPPESYAHIISEDDWKYFVAKRLNDSFQKLSDENRQRASKPSYPYRGSRMGYACLEQKMLEEAGSKVTSIPRYLLWKSARVNKKGVIDHENVQQVWDHCERLLQGKIQDYGRQDILGRALNVPERPGCVRGLGFGVSQKNYFPPQKRSKQQDESELQRLRDMVESLQRQVNILTQKEVERPTDLSSPSTKDSFTLATAHLPKCLEGFGDEDTPNISGEAGEKGASTQETEGSTEDCQYQKDAKDCCYEDEERMEYSPVSDLLKEQKTSEVEIKDGSGRKVVPSEILIKKAIRKRASYIRANAENVTVAGLRWLVEEDLELDKFTLDSHKKFIIQQLDEVLNSSEVSTEGESTQETKGTTEECQSQNDAKDCCSEDEEKMEYSLVLGLLKLKEQKTVEVETKEDKDSGRQVVPSEILIKKAIRERASYIRANTENVTMAGLRRLLEEDLELDKFTLDSYKKFISQQLCKVLNSSEVSEPPKNAKKIVKKKPDTKATKKVSSEGNCDTSDKESDEEDEVKPRKKMVPKVKMQNSTITRKRKGALGALSSKKRVKLAKEALEDGSDAEVSGKNTEDNQSHSLQEKSTKKKEVSTPLYGKHMEHLKFIIETCAMSVLPSIYKMVKEVSVNEREAQLIKELEILSREGLSSNPSEKEIKEVRKKERTKELEGMDVSNIVSSSRRRSVTSFAAPPKPRIHVETNSNDSEHSDDDNDDEDSEDEEEDTSDHDGSQSDDFNEDEDSD